MRTVVMAGALLAMALSVPVVARADETQDFAVCANATEFTDREAPLEERLVACNRMIKAHGAKAAAGDFYYRSTVYSALERPSDALADLDTALELSTPDDVLRTNYYLDRAEDILLAGLRTPDAALADTTAAMKIISARGRDPRSGFEDDMARAYFWRGGAYAEKKDKAQASADFEKALSYSVDPTQREAMIKVMTALGYPQT